MNKLRLYLILAILFVGLIPDPNKLLDEYYKGCHSYDSLFINIHWDWNSCAVVSEDVIALRIPGNITGEDSIIREIFPAVYMFIWPSAHWQTWGSIYQPRMWNKRGIWELANLQYDLFPEAKFVWSWSRQ